VVSDEDGCGEVELRWTQSTDAQDPQSAIRYRIFINGVPDPVGFDPIGTGRTITYGVVDGTNTFVLRGRRQRRQRLGAEQLLPDRAERLLRQPLRPPALGRALQLRAGGTARAPLIAGSTPA
jgi:hypothetical protein